MVRGQLSISSWKSKHAPSHLKKNSPRREEGLLYLKEGLSTCKERLKCIQLHLNCCMTLRWTHGDSSKHNSAVQTSVQVESRGSEYLTSSNPEKTSEWYIEIRLLGVPIEKPPKQNRSYLNWKSYLFRKCNAECRKIFTFITSNLVLFWPWLTGLTTHHTPSSGATPCDTPRRHLTQGSPTAKGNFPTRISKRNTCSDSVGPRKCVNQIQENSTISFWQDSRSQVQIILRHKPEWIIQDGAP